MHECAVLLACMCASSSCVQAFARMLACVCHVVLYSRVVLSSLLAPWRAMIAMARIHRMRQTYPETAIVASADADVAACQGAGDWCVLPAGTMWARDAVGSSSIPTTTGIRAIATCARHRHLNPNRSLALSPMSYGRSVGALSFAACVDGGWTMMASIRSMAGCVGSGY